MISYNSLKHLLKLEQKSLFFSKGAGSWLSPLSEVDPGTLPHVTRSSLKQLFTAVRYGFGY